MSTTDTLPGVVPLGGAGSAGSEPLSGHDAVVAGDALYPERPRIVPVRVRTAGGDHTISGERTECPHLWITPVIGPVGELTGDWRLTHGPTGLRVPGTDGLDPRELRDMARLIGDLEVLGSSEPQRLRDQGEYLAARIGEARDRVTR